MIFTEEIQNYAEQMTSGESDVLRELREHCSAHYSDSSMLSGFVQGRILSMFSRMIRPRKVLEIGTYLGYSTICLAEGLAEGGEVVSLDMNEETNAVAQSFIDKSGLGDRIQLRLGDAIFMLPHMAGPYDLVFIDADKPNYCNYYNLVTTSSGAGRCWKPTRTRTQKRCTNSTKTSSPTTAYRISSFRFEMG
jgi:caffeoyl-CoA O-methyltransferase